MIAASPFAGGVMNNVGVAALVGVLVGRTIVGVNVGVAITSMICGGKVGGGVGIIGVLHATDNSINEIKIIFCGNDRLSFS